MASKIGGMPRAGPLVLPLVLGSGLVAATACDEPYAVSTDDGGASASSSTSTSSSGGTSSGAVDAAGTPEGRVACATTSTSCELGAEGCCVTVSGQASAAIRSVNGVSAVCVSVADPGCGSLVQVGSDFVVKLRQDCARARDCAAGEDCCALPLGSQPDGGGGDRFAKDLSRIGCVKAPTCAATGRVLCRTKDDCPTGTNCTQETDPVLSRLYGSFCL